MLFGPAKTEFFEEIRTSALSIAEGVAAGQAIAARPRARRPDAVFAANDLVAIGLLQAFAHARDIRVPDDVALVGYDDIDFANASTVPLTSVRQPAALIGATALRFLLEEAEDPGLAPRQAHYQPELVVRSSSASAPSA